MSRLDRTYSEKRDFIRMRINTPVKISYAGQEFEGNCVDLSSTGLQLEAATFLQLGERLSVFIPSEHQSLQGLRIEAEVVRLGALANGHQALGLSILSMD